MERNGARKEAVVHGHMPSISPCYNWVSNFVCHVKGRIYNKGVREKSKNKMGKTV
jgi:hypothetical protein